MIKATVNKCDVSYNIEGKTIGVMSELTLLVDTVFDKMADDDKAAKNELVEVFCNCLKYINEKEN